MILLLDNYDSFVYNLGRYFQELGCHIEIARSDSISVGDIRMLAPRAIVISPGPCTPNEAGISLEVVQRLGSIIPILGICLGHQTIGQAFGGVITKAMLPVHGQAKPIQHDGTGIFHDVPAPLMVGRYHSLVVAKKDFPAELIPTSYSDEGEIMSLQHRSYKIVGLQFHPESILTDRGYQLLENFLKMIA